MVRALVVDDDPAFLSLATRLLEDAGFSVAATAPTAQAGLTTAHEVKPDVALVDVGLPDRSGIDLARDIVALPWGPRVVLTSTDRDAMDGLPPDGLPQFVPKEDLIDAPLGELLARE